MDSEKPRQSSSTLRDFAGQYSDVSPEVIPQGGMELQINCFSLKTGELTTRGGLLEIVLDTLDE